MQRGRYLHLAALAGALTLTVGIAQPGHAAALPASTALPTGYAEVNLTTGSGNTSVAGTGPTAVWTTNVVGGDIQGKADRGYFVYTPLAGDGGITAHLLSQVRATAGAWMKTGVMLRQDTTAGSPMATINQATGQHGTEYLFRIKQDANAGDVQGGPFGTDAPQWLRVQRQGQSYQVLLSGDGKRWHLIQTKTLPIDATKPVLAGLDGSTASDTITGLTTYDNVSVTADIVQPTPEGVAGGLQSLPGDGVVLLMFNTVQNASGYNIYRRLATDTPDKAVLANPKPDPYGWFIDTSATNGTNYIYTVRPVYGSGAKATEGFDSASVLGEPQVPIAPGFRSLDITTLTPGSTTLAGGVLTITASGADITGSGPDGFRFVAMAREDDYTISAKLLEKPSQGPNNTETWVKAGVMIRESLDPAAPAGWCVATTGQGVHYEHRATYAAASVNDAGTTVAKSTFPVFLRMTKAGTSVSAFQSSDGTTYTQIGKAVTFPDMAAEPYTYAGLAVTAHKDGTTATAKFDAASIQFGTP